MLTAKQEIAQNALQMKMPIDDIVKLTGLNEEEIMAIQDVGQMAYFF